jgi:hypothetical protein
MSRAVLLGIGGRKVMDLVPGPNDVSRLAPGVYFVREQALGYSQRSDSPLAPSAVRKVVVTRQRNGTATVTFPRCLRLAASGRVQPPVSEDGNRMAVPSGRLRQVPVDGQA